MGLKVLAVIGLIALMAIGSLVLWHDDEGRFVAQPITKPKIKATLLEPARMLAPFALMDHLGNSFTNEQLKGKWTWLFAGYTHCPDVCPTTLSTLKTLSTKLHTEGVTADSYQIVFLTVDPKRDTQAHLKDYMAYFDEKFIGVRGDDDSTLALTTNLSMVYMQMENSRDPENYIVDHSTAIVLLDPAGQFRGLFSAPQHPTIMADDFLKIRKYYQQVYENKAS